MKTFTWALIGVCIFTASPASANDRAGPPQRDVEISIGAGAIYSPAFFGSKDYQTSAVPNISVKYKDQFFASVPTGVGYNVIRNNGWRVGPLVKYAFSRQEADGSSPFQVAGDETDALRGLGDVDGTPEIGMFAEYTEAEWSAKMEARQGAGGHEGFVADLNVNYTKVIPPSEWVGYAPLIVSVGPRATLVDSTYNQAYFGVDGTQSARSGLPQYNAGGGLLSYGVGATVILPVTRSVTATSFAGYDRVAGDAADSPLVQQRGSENQATAGVFLSYSFGY